MSSDQQTREERVTAYARLAIVMGGTFAVISAVTLLLLAGGRGRWDMDVAVLAMGVASGLVCLAGWAMIAAWGLFSRGGVVARTGALLYAVVAAVVAFAIAGGALMLNVTGDGPATASLVLAAQAVWAFLAAVTSAGVRSEVCER